MRDFLTIGRMSKQTRSIALSVFMVLATSPAGEAQVANESTTNKDGSTGQIVLSGAQKTPLMLGSKEQIKKERLAKLDQTMLHRLDFRVVGSGCAACLGRVRKRIDKVKGVYEVAVAIKKPYGVGVIYDSSQTTKDKLIDAAKKDEQVEVKFEDIVDEKIEKPPLILIPKQNSLLKKEG